LNNELDLDEQPIVQVARSAPDAKCDHCKQRFTSAGKKFEHQRIMHGDMEGWLSEEERKAT